MINKDKNINIQKWIDDYTLDLLKKTNYLISSKEDAEDLVQDVFISAFENYEKFQWNSSVKTWLISILKNKISDFYRKKYNNKNEITLDYFFDENGNWIDKNILNDWTENENNIRENYLENYLENCLEKLPNKWLIPIKLYYLKQKKTELVCQEIGITSTNLWKILQRARLQLRECIESNLSN